MLAPSLLLPLSRRSVLKICSELTAVTADREQIMNYAFLKVVRYQRVGSRSRTRFMISRDDS